MALACAAPADAGRLVTGLEAPSPVLGRPIRYAAYVPADAPPEGTRWPVVYLLHGFGGDERQWADGGGVVATLDAEIAAGRLPPLMAVMPMAGNSWYVDAAPPAGGGDVARAMTTDLVGWIDRAWPTAACREGRVVAGLSMGGYGALLYAFDRPDLFGGVVSLSGSIFREAPADPAERARRTMPMYRGVFGEPMDWERYDAWNLFPRVAAVASLERPPAIWLAAGDDDFPAILEGTVRLHAMLRQAGVASELRILDGRHDWQLWSTALAPGLAWQARRLVDRCD